MNCRVCNRPLRSPESVRKGMGPCCAKKMSFISTLSSSVPALIDSIDPTTLTIMNALERAGFESLVVGGATRDRILGEPVNDFDICTNANLEQIRDVLKDKVQTLNLVGKNYGVIIADGIEVAMYRSEKYATVGKPDVQPASSFQEDSKRRDFTINALAEKIDGTLLDYQGGLSDIQNRLIRAVGNPNERFKEDYSRMLRAVYFASRFDFSIESNTLDAIKKNAYHLEGVPRELIGKIVKKVMNTKRLQSFLTHLKDTELLPYVFPSIAHTVNQPQNPKYHHKDVFGHIVQVVESACQNGSVDAVQQLGALFHDNAKALPHIRGVNKEGQPNDLGHEEAGRERAEQAVLELGYGKEMAKDVGFLVGHHGLRLEPNAKEKSIVKALRKLASEAKNKEDLTRKIETLFIFMEHDANGFTPSFGDKVKADNRLLKERFIQALQHTVLYSHELPISGKEVASFGFKGKDIKETLNEMVDMNIQSYDQAMKYVTRKQQKSLNK